LRESRFGGKRDAETVDHEEGRELARTDVDLQVIQVGDALDDPRDEPVQRGLVERQSETAPSDLQAFGLGRKPLGSRFSIHV
jgi:hypothetical protein